MLVLVETLGHFANTFAFLENESAGMTAGALHDGLLLLDLVLIIIIRYRD